MRRLVALAWLVAMVVGCHNPRVPVDAPPDVNCSWEDGLLARESEPVAMNLDTLMFVSDVHDVSSGGNYNAMTPFGANARLVTFEARRTLSASRGRFLELTAVGERTMDVRTDGRAAGTQAWSTGTLGWVDHPIFVPDTDLEPERLRWTDMAAGLDLVSLDLEARFPADGCVGRVHPGGVQVWNDELLWMVRQLPCVGREYADFVRVHLFRRDGTEVAEVEAPRPADSPFASEFTVEAGIDGSLWYLAHWVPAPADVDQRRGLRALRFGPTGELAAVSPLLAATSDVGVLVGRVAVYAPWADVTASGAYVVHFATSPIDFRTPLASHVARIEPDGTLAWQWDSPEGIAAVPPGGLAEPSVTLDGERVVVAVTSQRTPDHLAVVRIDADGTTRDGPGGRRLVEALDPTRLETMALDADGEGGFFVGWVPNDGETFVQHFSGELEPHWPEPISIRNIGSNADAGLETTLRSDGLGGVWVMSTRFIGWSYLQHLDVTGRPLFWAFSGYLPCQHEPTAFAWPDPDEPPIFYDDGPRYTPDAIRTFEVDADAGVLDAGMGTPDGGAMDAASSDAEHSGG